MSKIDISLPLDGDPMAIKEKGLELQNHLDIVYSYYDAAYYMMQCGEAELSRIRDLSLVDSDLLEKMSRKAVNIKTSYGKSKLKYKVEIKSPKDEDDFNKDISGEYTYDELKKIVAFLKFRFNRAQSRLKQVEYGISYAQFYPLKAL